MNSVHREVRRPGVAVRLPLAIRVDRVGVVLAQAAWCALAVLVAALLVIGVASFLAQAQPYAGLSVVVLVAPACIWIAAACVVFWRQPADRMALLTATCLLANSLAAANVLRDAAAATGPVWWWLATGVHSVGALTLAVFVAVFPDGRWVPGWTRWVALGWAVLLLPTAVMPGSLLDSTGWPGALLVTALLGVAGSAIYSQVWRYRHTLNVVQQQQSKWAIFGISAALGGWVGLVFVLYVFLPQPEPTGSIALVLFGAAFRLVQLAIPVSVAIAVTRYRLWDIDPLVRRTLVYGGLTAAVVGLYVLVVGYFSVFFQLRESPFVALLATGLVAVVVQPLREFLQRGVSRLLYGKRAEPYAVLPALTRQLEYALLPEAALRAIVETVADALKLPYVAITLRQRDASEMVAVHGSTFSPPECWQLVYQAEAVGELLVAPRAPGETFSQSDRRLLDDLARQAGMAAFAVRTSRDLHRLAHDLQQSREGLVATREEERRRLGRDLHDSVGPTLASLVQRVDAAARLVVDNPEAAGRLLEDVKTQARAALFDIRQMAYSLRPPALDELGLISAIREHAVQHIELSGVLVSIDAPLPSPTLPAAVEVAAYRIVLEALANVVHHAHARTCRVAFEFGDDLLIEVSDDGVGVIEGARAGVGLASMRERAEELGGEFALESTPGAGTRVRLRLPCSHPHHQTT